MLRDLTAEVIKWKSILLKVVYKGYGWKGHEMLREENRRIKKCQLTDIKLSFLDEYYSDKNRVNDIILVFDNGNLKTLLGFKDYENIKNQQQLDFYLKYSANCSLNNSMESASKIFERFPMYNYLIIGINDERGEFICKNGADCPKT